MAYIQRITLTRRIEDDNVDAKQEHLMDLIQQVPGITAMIAGSDFKVASIDCWRMRVKDGDEIRAYDDE